MQTTVTHFGSGGSAGVRPPRPLLRLLHGPSGEETSWPLPAGTHGVGRDNALVLLSADARVSREHATLVVEAGGRRVRLERCVGRNGTFLNRSRLAEGQSEVLQDGDLVRVGDSFLIYRADAPEEAGPRVPEIVGVSPAAARLREWVGRVARERVTVLLHGETGTGKEVVSSALHRLGGRSGAHTPINCGAIPHDLAESVLFGHVAGAFTGARAQEGAFRAAEGGTLLLDEVGELPPALQPKLLRALEQRAVLPVGATREQPCDVRVVAATHRDLAREVDAGHFRADLYARLAELVLVLPPLRDRREDVMPLLRHAGCATAGLPPDVVDLLVHHPWPMNVREVFKVASHIRVFGADDGLKARLSGGHAPLPPAGEAPAPRVRRLAPPTRDEVEELLERHQGVVQEVALALGCSRRQVGRLIDQHGIDRARFRVGATE